MENHTNYVGIKADNIKYNISNRNVVIEHLATARWCTRFVDTASSDLYMSCTNGSPEKKLPIL